MLESCIALAMNAVTALVYIGVSSRRKEMYPVWSTWACDTSTPSTPSSSRQPGRPRQQPHPRARLQVLLEVQVAGLEGGAEVEEEAAVAVLQQDLVAADHFGAAVE